MHPESSLILFNPVILSKIALLKINVCRSCVATRGNQCFEQTGLIAGVQLASDEHFQFESDS
jgi:hypothetical protein